jgi:hypothetical protein
MWIAIGQTMQRSDDITLWQDNEQPFCDAKSFEPPRRVWVKCTHYRIAAFLSASSQLPDVGDADRHFVFVP